MKRITIKKIDNENIQILSVLKSLYMDGSEVNSLEKIGEFLTVFKENGEISIVLSNNAFEIFEGYFKDELKYKVVSK